MVSPLVYALNDCYHSGEQLLIHDNSTGHVRYERTETIYQQPDNFLLATIEDERIIFTPIVEVFKNELTNRLLRIELSTGHSLMITESHPVWVNDTFITAGTLSIDDTLTSITGESVSIMDVKVMNYDGFVYNFAINGSGIQISDGIRLGGSDI